MRRAIRKKELKFSSPRHTSSKRDIAPSPAHGTGETFIHADKRKKKGLTPRARISMPFNSAIANEISDTKNGPSFGLDQRIWTTGEEETLRENMIKHSHETNYDWVKVGAQMTELHGISSSQCRYHWLNVMKGMTVKGAWTPQEDALLRRRVKVFGAKKWSVIAELIPGRVGKQCRERWLNHLCGEVNKEPWDSAEDRVLCAHQKRLGNKWSQISKLMNGRSENAVKNRFNSLMNRTWSRDVSNETQASIAALGFKQSLHAAKVREAIAKGLPIPSLNTTMCRRRRGSNINIATAPVEQFKRLAGESENPSPERQNVSRIYNSLAKRGGTRRRIPNNNPTTGAMLKLRDSVEMCIDNDGLPDSALRSVNEGLAAEYERQHFYDTVQIDPFEKHMIDSAHGLRTSAEHNLDEIMASGTNAFYNSNVGAGKFANFMENGEEPMFPSYGFTEDIADLATDLFRRSLGGNSMSGISIKSPSMNSIPGFSIYSPSMKRILAGNNHSPMNTSGPPSFSAMSPSMRSLRSSLNSPMGSIFSNSRLSKELASFGYGVSRAGGGSMSSLYDSSIPSNKASYDLDLETSLTNSIARLSISRDGCGGLTGGRGGGGWGLHEGNSTEGPDWLSTTPTSKVEVIKIVPTPNDTKHAIQESQVTTRSRSNSNNNSTSPTVRESKRNHLRPSNLANLSIPKSSTPPLPMSTSPIFNRR